MAAARPHSLYVAALVAILIFFCTVQLFRSSSSPSSQSQIAAQQAGWRDWMWPSYDDKSTMIKSTPPKFVRPPPDGEGSIPKDEVATQRWSEHAPTSAVAPAFVEETPAPIPEWSKEEHKKEHDGEYKVEHNEEHKKEDVEEHKEESKAKMMKEEDCSSKIASKANALPALNTTFHVPDNMHYSTKGPDPSEVVVVTATDGKGHNGGIEDIIGQTSANRKAYCDHHGYNYHFVNISKFDLEDAHPVWKKIPAIVDAFNKYPKAQWVFFLDLDAIIMSPKQDLNSLILSHAGMAKNLEFGKQYHGNERTPLGTYMSEREDVKFEDVDMLVAQDHNGVNAGSFFLRRSKFTQWMLDMWADPFFMRMDWPGQEQDTLLHLIKHHKVFRQHLGLIRQRVANAYTEGNDEMKWQAGDLVVHFAGCWVDDECQQRWQQFWKKRDILDYLSQK